MVKRNLDIDLLRFFAITLVINSHMDAFYPLAIMGTGGAIGNALFFMLSSFGLLLSEQNRPQRFVDYLTKRVKRIYPVYWLVMVLLMLPIGLYYFFYNPEVFGVVANSYRFTSPLEFGTNLYYPPPAFWFLQALMIYYVVGFFFIHHFAVAKILFGMAALLMLYIVLYARIPDFSVLAIEQTMHFKLVFYAMVFLYGIALASVNDRIVYRGPVDIVALLACLVVMYGHKLLALAGHVQEWQFIQQLSLFPMLFFAIKVARAGWLQGFLGRRRWLSRGVGIVAAMTLELYIVHGPLRELMLPHIGGFPGNVLVYVSVVFLLAYLFYRLNGWVMARFLARA